MFNWVRQFSRNKIMKLVYSNKILNYQTYKVGGGGGCAQFNFYEIKTKWISFTGWKNQQNMMTSF